MIKAGVDIAGARPEIVIGMAEVREVYRTNGYEFTVTSVKDGSHRPDSLHYEGLAFDVRTRNIPEHLWERIAQACKIALGGQWDVVLEATHLHVEFDP